MNMKKNSFYLILCLIVVFIADLFVLSVYLSYSYSLWFVIPATITLLFMLVLLTSSNSFFIYPIMELVSKCLRIDPDSFRHDAIQYSNARVLKRFEGKKIKGRILMLLPHCIQNSECLYKVTLDKLENCRLCGKCCIPKFLELKKDYKLDVVIVSGGTAAREIIKHSAPSLILAVACESDLVSGLRDVKNIPVIGVLNERPCGPCKDTSVNIDEIRRYLDLFLD